MFLLTELGKGDSNNQKEKQTSQEVARAVLIIHANEQGHLLGGGIANAKLLPVGVKEGLSPKEEMLCSLISVYKMYSLSYRLQQLLCHLYGFSSQQPFMTARNDCSHVC